MTITFEIEAVARAIYDANPVYVRDTPHQPDNDAIRLSFNELPYAHLHLIRKQAISAIRALREPTYKMTISGLYQKHKHSTLSYVPLKDIDYSLKPASESRAVEAIYTAMIDMALGGNK